MSAAVAEAEPGFKTPADAAPALPLALVVDDAPLDRRMATAIIEKCGLRVECAADGCEALAAIGRAVPAVIITDLQMPNMDGLQLVEAVRADFPWVPVVLMTSRGSEEIAIAALHAGAAHYFAKRNLKTELPVVLPQVLAAARTDRRRHELLSCVEHVDCRFVLDNDPAMVPLLVAHLQEQLERMGLCDKSSKIRVGVALEEALLNGIYHGNLEVSSVLKEESEGAFRRLAEQRRRQEPYCRRKLSVDVHLNTTKAVFVIHDDGPGFDVTQLPDPTDPENLLKPSGRGLLLIRTFMDEAVHNAAGNQITMMLRRRSSPVIGNQ
ncbi:MAG: response regulator [Gemmataceae bacterium]